MRMEGGIRANQGGFTLIEILLALAVLAIGLVGVLAMFPVGINNSKLAIHDTTAANIAESVKSAVVQSLKLKAAGTKTVTLYHDGVSTGLTFDLPETDPIDASDFERLIPKEATGGSAAGDDVFKLGQSSTTDLPFNVAPGDDRDTAASQWAFNIRIRPTSSPAVKNTYELLIQIYRNYDTGDEPLNTFATIVNTSPTK